MTYNKYLIYALVDPISSEIRYIGRSSSGLALSCSASRVYEIINQQQCYNGITIKIGV